MTTVFPHRLFTDPWPLGNEWTLVLSVNSSGYITGVGVMHRTSAPGRKPSTSDYVRYPVGPFDDLIDLVREGIIASACSHGDQLDLGL